MIKTITLAIQKASDHALLHFNKQHNISFKDNDELVTQIDKDCEKLIKQTILKKYPEHKFWGEEGGQSNNNSNWTWIVDPIDGSVNYSRGINLFGISIAVAYKNNVIAAGVLNPITQELFLAEKNKGATLNGEKINVSTEKNLSHSVIYATELYKSHDYISKIYDKVKNFRITSSSAYETCLVACGRTEAFIKITTHPWGFAAANLIVDEAGGKVTNFDGTNWDINSTHILSSNSAIHDELLKLINLR